MHDEIKASSLPSTLPETPWKREILDNCRRWLAEIEDMPAPEAGDLSNEPDLYSFYEQLCVLRSEFRKNSRRTHDLFGQFGEHLEEFQSVLDDLTQKAERNADIPGTAGRLARRGLLLQMAELYERLRLFGEKMADQGKPIPQKTGFREKIRDLFAVSSPPVPESLSEGFDLLLAHFHDFLESEGVVRIRTTGEPFDPTLMMAVGVTRTDDYPPDMVCEEISGGYLHDDQVLILAKVTVSKSKEQ